jgi:tight adherence protein B
MRFGCAAFLALVGLLRFGVGLQPIVMAVLGYFIPGLYLRYRQGRRRRAFQQQLVDTVTLLSSALKAGHSFPQALDTVARNGNPPISEEFDRVVREMNIGGSAEQALQKLVRRVESDDLDLIVTAVLIHSTVGGNLSRILDAISNTIRERIRVRGEISAITAQARASGWIITLLPVVVAGILYFIAPGYFRPMTSQLLGWLMLAFCAISIFIGNLIIRRITRIRV